jgi:RNA 3'-terminal phosphate cyclase (ATP)
MLQIDGSFGEGGGQILRSSLTLSPLTGRPFRLRNIRARRERPGLQPQHLTCVLAAAEVGRAQTRGASRGSSTLDFEPAAVKAGDYRFAIGTAGATGLVLHTVYLPLALQPEPSTVSVEGGTHNDHSPCYHFLEATWRAYMARIGIEIDLTMRRPGFYPRGVGQVVSQIAGRATLRSLTLNERGPLTRVAGFSAAAGLPPHLRVAERQAERAVKSLSNAGFEVDVWKETWPGGPGSVVGLTFDEAPVPTLFFGLGARGKPAEAVAEEAVGQALAYAATDAPVDEHSADQLLLPLALAAGPSEYRVTRVTRHLLTNAEVIRKFLDRDIRCDGNEGEPGRVLVAAGGP